MVRYVSTPSSVKCVFFFNDTATTEIYTLSLHDALPISRRVVGRVAWKSKNSSGSMSAKRVASHRRVKYAPAREDRKSTRLNSSHANISYAVFCLKKKKHPGRPPTS